DEGNGLRVKTNIGTQRHLYSVQVQDLFANKRSRTWRSGCDDGVHALEQLPDFRSIPAPKFLRFCYKRSGDHGPRNQAVANGGNEFAGPVAQARKMKRRALAGGNDEGGASSTLYFGKLDLPRSPECRRNGVEGAKHFGCCAAPEISCSLCDSKSSDVTIKGGK